MTGPVKSRWDAQNIHRRIARALSRTPEAPLIAVVPDQANLGFLSGDQEVYRVRNYPQPASGKALVEVCGFVRAYTSNSQLYWKIGLDTATLNGGGAGFNGGYSGTQVIGGFTLSDTATVFQIYFSAGGAPTGGNIQLTIGGQTATIPFGSLQASTAASVAAIQTAIAALSSVGTGNVHVVGSGTSSVPWVISLYGPAYGAAVTMISALTGGTTQTMALSTGLAQMTNLGKVTNQFLLNFDAFTLILANATGGTYRLKVGTQFVDIAYNATAATIKTAVEALSNVGTGNAIITGLGTSGSPFYISFLPQSPAGATVVNRTQPILAVDGTNLTGSTPTATLAYVGGTPGQLWDVCWHLASNGQSGIQEFNLTSARINTMQITPLPAGYPGIPAVV